MTSIITDNLNHCYVCGRNKEHIHHVIYGKNRNNSENYGLVIPVCFFCHNAIHNHPKHFEYLKEIAQEKWEENYGTRDDFVKVFRKNYL